MRSRLPDVGKWEILRNLRRLSQVLFLTAFLVLLYRTGYSGQIPSGNLDYRLPGWVRVFLDTDPLAAILNALATHSLYRGLIWSLALLVPALFLGRFFCGWICPVGTLNQVAGWLGRHGRRGRRRIESNRYRPWQEFKYYLLFALLAAAVLGSALGGIVDPMALAVRSFGLSVLPALGYAANHAGPLGSLLGGQPAQFRESFFLALILIAILALNLWITRLWCRAVCPLGALLGLGSRWSILGLKKRQSQCGDCNRCLLHCQGGDDPIPGERWRQAECHLCLNCVADCPDSGIRFSFFPSTPAFVARVDLKRRKVLMGVAAGAAAVPLLRANTGLDVESDSRRIRPPASLDERQFLARCIRCGECMKACPNRALHPALAEAGWEGIWTPVVVPRVGYCLAGCTLCGQACPTGAIREFTAAAKGWTAPSPAPAEEPAPIRLGTAFYDRGRCLPWSMATECMVCEEWCPTSPKAIYLQAAEVIDAAGNRKQIRQPYLDPARCVGCGACEFACPVKSSPAIYVTSAGESRSKTNQMLLPVPSGRVSWLPETGDAEGWIKTRENREFASGDLWKYVDGDAERYLRAGVQRTATASYRYREAVEAVADVHRMRSPSGATAIFESEPATGSRPAALGDSGRSYGQSVTFRRGDFFVRLVAYQDTPQTEAALIALGRAIDSRLNRR